MICDCLLIDCVECFAVSLFHVILSSFGGIATFYLAYRPESVKTTLKPALSSPVPPVTLSPIFLIYIGLHIHCTIRAGSLYLYVRASNAKVYRTNLVCDWIDTGLVLRLTSLG